MPSPIQAIAVHLEPGSSRPPSVGANRLGDNAPHLRHRVVRRCCGNRRLLAAHDLPRHVAARHGAQNKGEDQHLDRPPCVRLVVV